MRKSIYYQSSFRNYKWVNGLKGGIYNISSLSTRCLDKLVRRLPELDLEKIVSGRLLTRITPIDFEYRQTKKRGYSECIDGNIYEYDGIFKSKGDLGRVLNRKIESLTVSEMPDLGWTKLSEEQIQALKKGIRLTIKDEYSKNDEVMYKFIPKNKQTRRMQKYGSFGWSWWIN